MTILHGPHPPRDHGQVVPIAAALMGLCALFALGLGAVGRSALEGRHAQGVADAVALAAAQAPTPDAGRRDAQTVARHDGFRVASLRLVDGDVLVTVARGDRYATARARPIPLVPLGGNLD